MKGFTLIELMIVIAVLAILLAVLPVFRGGKFVIICKDGAEVVFQQENARLDAGIVFYGNGQYVIPPGVFCETAFIERSKQ